MDLLSLDTDALNFMTTETFLFTAYCPPGCQPACLERAFPSMALGLTIADQTKWFYDSHSSPFNTNLGSKLPARYSSRGLYEALLSTHARINIPVTTVPIIRKRRAKHDKNIKSRAPEYVPGPRMPLYYVTDAWKGSYIDVVSFCHCFRNDLGSDMCCLGVLQMKCVID